MRWLRLLVLLLALPLCVAVDAMVMVPWFMFFGSIALVRWAAGDPDTVDMVWFWIEDSFTAWWARGVRRAWGSR